MLLLLFLFLIGARCVRRKEASSPLIELNHLFVLFMQTSHRREGLRAGPMIPISCGRWCGSEVGRSQNDGSHTLIRKRGEHELRHVSYCTLLSLIPALCHGLLTCRPRSIYHKNHLPCVNSGYLTCDMIWRDNNGRYGYPEPVLDHPITEPSRISLTVDSCL